jgi:hypothetical protein
MKIKNYGEICVECKGCHASLIVEITDLKEDNSGHLESGMYAVCCNCGSIIELKRCDIPDTWIIKLGIQ